jgi:molecular chaperone DnaK
MVHDAELHAEEDKRRREVIQAKNQLDSVVYTCEKTLNENREKLDSGLIEELGRTLSKAKEVMSQEDAGALKRAVDEVNRMSQKMAEVLYKGAAAGQGAGESKGQQGAEGEVIDAEVTENK